MRLIRLNCYLFSEYLCFNEGDESQQMQMPMGQAVEWELKTRRDGQDCGGLQRTSQCGQIFRSGWGELKNPDISLQSSNFKCFVIDATF